MHPKSTRGQRGAAALVVTMLLFFAMMLVALFVNRNLVFEQRSAANQYRSTQAFEAAQAGLDWALAQLNQPQRLGPDCRPTVDPVASSFRSRYLNYVHASAMFVPATWSDSGVATALHPTCVRSGSGWACSCPSTGLPTLDPPEGTTPAAAFTLQFLPGDKPGIVRISATGCTSLAGACRPDAAAGADATAKIEVAFGLLAGLHTPPAAAITTRGAFDADTATVGVHNPDPTTGIAIHAGTSIAASRARLTTPAGAPTSGALVGGDGALAALGTDRYFAAAFGIDKAGWKNQPAVTRIVCRGDCSGALAAAIDATADSALIWVDGDLALSGPLTLGSPQRPVAIATSGAVRLEGAVALYGVLYGAALRWDDTAGGAFVRGAALSEGGYQGTGAPEFFYDTAVLAVLAGNAGSFARVNGSWRDF
ncbi:MAG: pilus assembly PilX N-terminal domain-containing protein [Burkholderiales bacterium]|nr:pilus assembly PilX N-terminal domain-containing protein [Burkholderiales bacterium]